MSFRPWSVIVAIGLAVVLFTVSGQAQQQASGTYWQAQAEQYPSSKPPPTVRVDIIENQSAADARKRREEEARQREIDDLIAQQGMNAATQAMNEATQKMVGLSKLQTWLVGVGTVLLFLTLGLTWQANRAAQAAVDVTRQVGEAQVRAYLYCESARYEFSKDYVAAYLCIKNAGQSPANEVEIIGDVALHDVVGTKDNQRVVDHIVSSVTQNNAPHVSANGSIDEPIIFFWDTNFPARKNTGLPSEADDPRKFGNEVTFDLTIKWTDVFGNSFDVFVALWGVIDASPKAPKKKRSKTGKLSFMMADAKPWNPNDHPYYEQSK